MEHQRTEDFQWVDTEQYAVMDIYTGQYQFIGTTTGKVGSKDEVLAYVKQQPSARRLIIKLSCIQAFRLEEV